MGEAIFQIWFDEIRKRFVDERKITSVENLIQILEKLLSSQGCDDSECIRNLFKKRARCKLESDFGSTAEIFLNLTVNSILLPHAVSMRQFEEDYLELQKQLEKSTCESDKSMKLVQEAAMIIRHEVSNLECPSSWPPTLTELNPDSFKLPNLLQHFLNHLVHGSSASSLKTSSFDQDVIYNVQNGRLITPKHLLIPFAIKSMTGNVELIKIMNRLGHGVSDTKLSEVDTAYAILKMGSSSRLLPDDIQTYQPASLVYDNIDRLEKTLSGSGTTHRVNGIVVQKPFIGPKVQRKRIMVPKTRQRSINVQPLELLDYNVGSITEPPILWETHMEVSGPYTTVAHKKNLIWLLCRNKNIIQQEVASWTGFNILRRKDNVVMKDIVGYLPTVDSPATPMKTVFEILSNAAQTKEEMKLKSIIVVFDEAIYSKAVEIIWKHGDLFSDIVPRLGAFHTICVLLSIIGKRFGPTGIRDIIIESGIIEEGSVEAVLNGEAYNRAARFHKLMYEACMSLA